MPPSRVLAPKAKARPKAPTATGTPTGEAGHVTASEGIASIEEKQSMARPELTPAIQDEATTLSRAQSGDHQAFACLYELHKRRIYSLCLRMLGNVAEAEDMTQEAFLQLHRKIATFRGDSAFSTWLHRLTVNVVLMHLRRKGLQLISMDEAMDPGTDDSPRRNFGTLDLALTGAIDRLTLERAVEDLPAGYRLIFILHDMEGYEHHEIATILECSVGNSKSQLHKARLRLRDNLRAAHVTTRPQANAGMEGSR